MVIDSNNNIGSAGSRSKSSGLSAASNTSKPQQAPEAAVQPQGKDSVSLSQAGHNLSRLEAQIAASPDFDVERVEAIKQAIADGSYSIDPEKLAENILKLDGLLN